MIAPLWHIPVPCPFPAPFNETETTRPPDLATFILNSVLRRIGPLADPGLITHLNLSPSTLYLPLSVTKTRALTRPLFENPSVLISTSLENGATRLPSSAGSVFLRICRRARPSHLCSHLKCLESRQKDLPPRPFESLLPYRYGKSAFQGHPSRISA